MNDEMKDYRFAPIEEQEPVEFEGVDEFLTEEDLAEQEEQQQQPTLFVAS